MTTPQFRHLITLSLAAAVLFWAPIVEAQSAADAKRTIRAQRKYYKEPGYIDAEIRYMRGTLLVTGWVGTEALVEQGWLERRRGQATRVAKRAHSETTSSAQLLKPEVDELVSLAKQLGIGRDELIKLIDSCW